MTNTKKLTDRLPEKIITGTIWFSGCLALGITGITIYNLYTPLNCFPKEKILTSSGTEYLQSEGKKIEDYDLIGIKSTSPRLFTKNCQNLCFNPPKNTEIIVSVSVSSKNGDFGNGTDIKRYDSSDKYLVNTAVGTFENTDAWYRLKFDSSDVQGEIKGLLGKTVEIEKYGWRVPILSMYENIVEVKEIK